MVHNTISGKVVWLTGASSGIGEALAFELAARGAKLAISARRGELLDQIVKRITSNGGSAIAIPCDVCDLGATKTALAAAIDQLGPIDLVIANAGSHLFTIPENFDSAEYLQLMQLNYGGMLHSIEAVLPGMLARKSGHIVGVASLAGYRGLPRAAAYGASKAAAIHFLESLRFHLEDHGLYVSIVNPGFVKTPLTDKNDFFMPFLVSAKKSAKIICNGIEKRKREITFPFPFNRFMQFMRIVPYTLYASVARRLWKMMK